MTTTTTEEEGERRAKWTGRDGSGISVSGEGVWGHMKTQQSTRAKCVVDTCTEQVRLSGVCRDGKCTVTQHQNTFRAVGWPLGVYEEGGVGRSRGVLCNGKRQGGGAVRRKGIQHKPVGLEQKVADAWAGTAHGGKKIGPSQLQTHKGEQDGDSGSTLRKLSFYFETKGGKEV